MAKEGRYSVRTSSNNRGPIWRETFDDPSSKPTLGTETDLILSDGVATFNGTTSNILYQHIRNGIYSIRIKLKELTPTTTQYLLDYRKDGGVGYVRIDSEVLVSSSSGTIYVDGALSSTISSATKEITITGIILTSTSLYIGSDNTEANFFVGQLELIEEFDSTLSASSVLDLKTNSYYWSNLGIIDWSQQITSEVNTSDPTQIIVTFSKANATLVKDDFSISGKTISLISKDATNTIYTLILSTSIIPAEELTLVINKGSGFTSEVTNNLLILDYAPSPMAAYSVRKLRTAYTGKCLRIRRASDDEETDIGFDGKFIDTFGIMDFCRGETVIYITKWYDQSGNNETLSQTTPANQPIIMSDGELLIMGQLPAITSSNGLCSLISDNSTSWSPSLYALFIVMSTSINTGTYAVISGKNNYNQYFYNRDASGARYYDTIAADIPMAKLAVDVPHQIEILKDGSTGVKIWENGTNIISNASINDTAATGWVIMERNAGSNMPTGSTIQEVILYGTDKTSIRTVIENDQKVEFNLSSIALGSEISDIKIGDYGCYGLPTMIEDSLNLGKYIIINQCYKGDPANRNGNPYYNIYDSVLNSFSAQAEVFDTSEENTYQGHLTWCYNGGKYHFGLSQSIDQDLASDGTVADILADTFAGFANHKLQNQETSITSDLGFMPIPYFLNIGEDVWCFFNKKTGSDYLMSYVKWNKNTGWNATEHDISETTCVGSQGPSYVGSAIVDNGAIMLYISNRYNRKIYTTVSYDNGLTWMPKVYAGISSAGISMRATVKKFNGKFYAVFNNLTTVSIASSTNGFFFNSIKTLKGVYSYPVEFEIFGDNILVIYDLRDDIGEGSTLKNDMRALTVDLNGY